MKIPKNKDIEVLPFDPYDIEDYIKELIFNKITYESVYEFVSEIYDEKFEEDKEKWKKRLDFFKKFLK